MNYYISNFINCTNKVRAGNKIEAGRNLSEHGGKYGQSGLVQKTGSIPASPRDSPAEVKAPVG
jgi:hypothetical protein